MGFPHGVDHGRPDTVVHKLHERVAIRISRGGLWPKGTAGQAVEILDKARLVSAMVRWGSSRGIGIGSPFTAEVHDVANSKIKIPRFAHRRHFLQVVGEVVCFGCRTRERSLGVREGWSDDALALHGAGAFV